MPDSCPQIRTARLLLRPLAADDAEPLTAIANEPGVRKYLWDDQPVALATVQAIIDANHETFARLGYGVWALCRADGDLIGCGGLRQWAVEDDLEVLYMLATAEWGRGLATEATGALLRYGFEHLGLARVVGLANPANTASARVLQKAGMRPEKTIFHHGEPLLWHVLTRHDYHPGHLPYDLRLC